MSVDVIDEALERFAATGPEFGPGLSNHGPMAAEALVAMGREDAVLPWAEWYARRLQDHPQARKRIAADEWREALGDIGREGDWDEFFRRELSERAWEDVLKTWVARLAPGIMAGATHGIIRTGHAVRSLDRGENQGRIDELAEALAYWAARYQELPTSAVGALRKSARMSDALPSVPLVAPAARSAGLIFDAVRAVDAESFAPAIDYVSLDVEAGAFVSDLTSVFVRQYVANAATASISFIHCVTAPGALRILAPHLRAETSREAMRYTWQACAAIYSAYGRGETPPLATETSGTEPFDADDLIDRAVASRDEHAIKFTEACLREHAISPNRAFIAAASDAVVRLRRS